MKTKLFYLFLFVSNFAIDAQTIFGKWKTVDDVSSEVKSIVEIYENNGKAYARIVQVLEKGKENAMCTKCPGDRKNKPLKGLQIIDGLIKKGAEWSNSRILDPKTGKEYKCVLSLESENKLRVRGYIGFSLMGRTQYWYRLKD